MTIKTALITGATHGLGYEFAKIFAKNDYNLVLVARDKEKLVAIQKELIRDFKVGVLIISKDLSRHTSSLEIYKEVQKNRISIQVLVNNAGFATYGKFIDNDLQEELDEITVNVSTLTTLTKLFAKDMVTQKTGRILNVASIAAFVPGPLMAVYYATKSYVLSFSEALSEELKGTGVTVTALCPGPTKTNFAKRANLQNTYLFKNRLMDPAAVAEVGYAGLIKGKQIVIPGIRNKIMVNLVRFVPRSFIPPLLKKLHQIKSN